MYSAINSFYILSFLFSLSSPSCTSVMQILMCLMVSHISLRLDSLKLFFSFGSSDCVVSTDLPSSSLILSSTNSNLLNLLLSPDRNFFHVSDCTFQLQDIHLFLKFLSIG